MAPRLSGENEQQAPRIHAALHGTLRAPDPAAAVVERAGLAGVLALLTDLVRPVAWLGVQAALILEPTLTLLGAGPVAARLVRTLEAIDSPPPDEHGDSPPC